MGALKAAAVVSEAAVFSQPVHHMVFHLLGLALGLIMLPC